MLSKEVSKIIENMLQAERPESVLEISGYDHECGELISKCIDSTTKKIDRVDLTAIGYLSDHNIYNKIYDPDCLENIDLIERYDVIIIFHMFENMPAELSKFLLEELLKKTTKQILVITSIYPYNLEATGEEEEISGVRAYHPVFFLGLDFSYNLFDTEEGIKQTYTFFPDMGYEKLPCDVLPERASVERSLKIAVILPYYQQLTGGLKSTLQLLRELTGKGHHVTIFFRSDTGESALPPWSHLSKEDVSAQVVIPKDELFCDYIDDVDIIMLTFVSQVPEFVDYKIPVVLWEHGFNALFGDNNAFWNSNTYERLYTHRLYRSEVRLLSVSTVISKVLKGVYNRDSQVFTNGIDTEFYYPCETKKNELPVVLLVGNPSVSLKGFDFAVKVLHETFKLGVQFKVWWASQVEFSLNNAPFPIEKYILPSQEKLAELYRNADVFISTSLYESFSLPPLEAMASGTAVISTDNGGINAYAKPGENCLICEQGDLTSMVFALNYLLIEHEARNSIAKAGRETSLQYSFSNIVPQLEKCLYNILAI